MIGWERRVLLRHYLEQGMTKTELAERFGISRQTIYRWIRSGELDRDPSAAGFCIRPPRRCNQQPRIPGGGRYFQLGHYTGN